MASGAGCVALRLAHGWRLEAEPHLPAELVTEFVQPAVRAVPAALAARLKRCHIRLAGRLELLSRWFPPNRGYRLFAASRR
jgi:hypothetical protein